MARGRLPGSSAMAPGWGWWLVAGDGGTFGQVVTRSGDMDYSVLGAGISFMENGGSCQRQRLGCTAVNWDGVRSGLARWLGSGLRCVSGASVELGFAPGTLCGRGPVQHGSTLSSSPEPPLGGAQCFRDLEREVRP